VLCCVHIYLFICCAPSGKLWILLARQGALYNSSLDSSIGDIAGAAAGLGISILWLLHVVRIQRAAAAGRCVCIIYEHNIAGAQSHLHRVVIKPAGLCSGLILFRRRWPAAAPAPLNGVGCVSVK
jgi:hypothetical protein